MKVQTTFPVERIDFSPLTRLVFPLLGQWDSLTFASEGTLLNGMTGVTVPHFKLMDGQHKKPGSSYAVITRDLGSDRTDAPPQLQVNFVTLHHDDRHKIEVSVLPEKDRRNRYSANLKVEKRAWPRGEITATVAHADPSTNPLARFSVGTATSFSGRCDPEVLQTESGGQFLHGTWSAGRFGGKGSVDVQQTSEQCWEITATASLSGRGIFRPLVFILSPVLRRLAKTVLADMQSDFTGGFPNFRLDLADIETATKTDADARLFVHRLLWDEDFADAGLFPRSSVIDEGEQASLIKQVEGIAPTPP